MKDMTDEEEIREVLESDHTIPEHEECPYCGVGPVEEYVVIDIEGSFDSDGRVCIQDRDDERYSVFTHTGEFETPPMQEFISDNQTAEELADDDGEKERVYRRFLQGEATEDDVREVFGDDYDEFVERQEFLDVIKETPTNSPSEDLLDDES